MKEHLTDKIRLQHIIDAISEIEKYLDGVNFDGFEENSEKRFATISKLKL